MTLRKTPLVMRLQAWERNQVWRVSASSRLI
jgi:hypothetical protein